MKKRHRHALPLLGLSFALVTALNVQAQESGDAAKQAMPQGSDIRPIGDWSYDSLYTTAGIRAEHLLGAQVLNPDDKALGTISDAILDEENQVVTLIAEVGGAWGSGERHVAVPWDEVELTASGVKMPIHEDNVEDYNLFNDEHIDEAYLYRPELNQATPVEPDVKTGPRTWRLTDILDDYVNLAGTTGFGYITDALLTRDGIMQAIVVAPSDPRFGDGPYAYPFYGYPEGWWPGATHYVLPYSKQDATSLPSFDFDRYDSLWQ